MAVNKAAWMKQKQQKPFEIVEAPVRQPNEREVIIRAHAVAINPCDFLIQLHGLVWDKYPRVIGCDVAGEIVDVGSNVKNFKKGDRVLACVEDGAFQTYVPADTALVAKLPEKIGFAEGSVLPATLTTAVVGLFLSSTLALSLPQLDPKPNGKTILIWGGSSCVGSCGIQLAKAAGYEVAAVAGAHNAQYCKDLGANYTFDRSAEGVAGTILETLKDTNFAGVFTAVIDDDVTSTCALIADRLGKDEKSRVVATVQPWVMPFNGSAPEGVRIAYCDGMAHFLPNGNLRTEQGMGQTLALDLADDIWGRWLTPALEKGVVKCKPDPEVVGKGLESVQDAVNKWGEGVSATKLVVEL